MAATEVFANQPQTTVTSGGTDAPSSGTVQTWTVASSSAFPAASSSAFPPTQFHACDTAAGKTGEIFDVTNVNGATWTVTRGAEGTTPVAHASGFTIQQVVTAGWLGTVATGAGSGVTVLVPAPTGATATDTPNVTAAVTSFTTALASGPATLLFQDGTYQVDSNSAVIRSPNTTTVASASNGAEPSTWVTGATGTLTVAPATGFPAAGQLWLAASGSTVALVSYTGTTSTTFTGVTYLSGSPLGTLSTGGAVTGVLSNFAVRSAGRTVLAQAPNRSGLANNVTGNICTIADCTDFTVKGITFDGMRDTVAPITALTASASSGQPSVTVASGQGARYLAGQYLAVIGGVGTSEANQSDGFSTGTSNPLVVSSITPGGGSGGGDLITFTTNLANTYSHVNGSTLTDGFGPYAASGAYVTPYQCGHNNSVAGRALSGEDQQNGLHLISCQRFSVAGVTARNTWESPLKCGTGFAASYLTDGCADGDVSGCYGYHGYDQGVSLWLSRRVTVSGCGLNATGWAGVSLSLSDECTVTACRVTSPVYSSPGDNVSGHGIAIEGGRRNHVTGNQVYNPNAVGVYLRMAPPVTAVNSTNSPTLSAFLETGTAAGTSVQVSSTANLAAGAPYSILDGAATEALTVASVVDGTHVTFSEPVRFSHASGVYLTVRVAEENEVSGNTIDGCGSTAVNPLASVRSLITRNVIRNWGTVTAASPGITLRSTSLLLPAALAGDGAAVEGNVIGGGAGVPLYAQTATRLKIRGNRLYGPLAGSAYNALILYTVLDSEVSGNDVSEVVGAAGVIIGSACARLAVSGNQVRLCGSQGIVAQASDSLLISGNDCGSNGDGIYLEGVTRSQVSGNTCNSNSGHGIYLGDFSGAGSLYNKVTGNTCRDDGSGVSVSTGNSFTQQHGITETGSLTNSNVVAGNVVDSNGTDQVVTAGAATVAYANTVSGTLTGLAASMVPFAPAFTAKSGAYIQGQQGAGTNSAPGNGTLRLAPLVVAQACTVAGIGAEFTAAGDAASLLRMAVYADDGTGYPGALLLDGGSVSTGTGNAGTVSTGGTPGVYVNTSITALALPPGLYWTGAVVQGVTSVQPTLRTALWTGAFAPAVTAVPGAGATLAGYTQTGVTGTLPGTFNALSSAGSAGSVPRVLLKLQ